MGPSGMVRYQCGIESGVRRYRTDGIYGTTPCWYGTVSTDSFTPRGVGGWRILRSRIRPAWRRSDIPPSLPVSQIANRRLQLATCELHEAFISVVREYASNIKRIERGLLRLVELFNDSNRAIFDVDDQV
jgi:hypothetical protein